MRDKSIVNTFSHLKPDDMPWIADGLRSFFEYRDLGIANATGGRVIAQLVRAKEAPEKGTGWHQHTADFHIVLMLKGWAKFMYEDKEHLVSAGTACISGRASRISCSITRPIWNILKWLAQLISERWTWKAWFRCQSHSCGKG